MKRFRILINPFGDLLFCTFFYSVGDSELLFWIESNVLSSAFSRPRYDALLSRIHLYLRSRVRMRMSYELVTMQVSSPAN